MNRLTKRDTYGHWYTDKTVYDRGLTSVDGLYYRRCEEIRAYDGEAINKLAAYEDIGLTPEQLLEIDKLYADKCREVADLKAKYEKTFERLEAMDESEDGTNK